MPDYNHLLTHPQLGPTLSATTWIAMPIVGATSTFMMKVAQRGNAIINAAVTVRVFNAAGAQVYPPTGSQLVPADSMIPGTYTLTPSSVAIFSTAGELYTVKWYVTVPSSVTEPQRVLPVEQKLVAQAP